VRDATVRGLVGQLPVKLRIEPIGGEFMTFDVTGVFRGQLSALRIRPQALQGTLGGCAYDLGPYDRTRNVGPYRGVRHCEGGAIEPVSVDALALFSWFSPESAVAMLGLLLGS
jgi:hypothetical protein